MLAVEVVLLTLVMEASVVLVALNQPPIPGIMIVGFSVFVRLEGDIKQMILIVMVEMGVTLPKFVVLNTLIQQQYIRKGLALLILLALLPATLAAEVHQGVGVLVMTRNFPICAQEMTKMLWPRI